MKGEANQLHLAFGRVLRDFRTAAKFSQEELALECGLDRTYISLLERGLRQPSIKTVFALGHALEQRPSRLIAALEKELNK